VYKKNRREIVVGDDGNEVYDENYDENEDEDLRRALLLSIEDASERRVVDLTQSPLPHPPRNNIRNKPLNF
jgi:hypothetical protein